MKKSLSLIYYCLHKITYSRTEIEKVLCGCWKLRNVPLIFRQSESPMKFHYPSPLWSMWGQEGVFLTFIPCLGIRFFAKTRIKALMPAAQISSGHFFLRLCDIPWMLPSPSVLLPGLQNLLLPKASHFYLDCPRYPLVSSTLGQSAPLQGHKENDSCLFWGVCGKRKFWHQSILVAVVLFFVVLFCILLPGTKSL